MNRHGSAAGPFSPPRQTGAARSRFGVAAVVAGVERSLQRAALIAAALWLGVAVALVLFLAWLGAGPEGWRQGTPGPLLLDLLLLASLGGGAGGFVWIRRRWLGKARIARSVEDAAGLGPGTVLGSLELSHHVPSGVSKELATFAEGVVLSRLERPDRHLAGALRQRIGGWIRGGLTALAFVVPVLVLVVVLTPGRTLSAWGGLSSPVFLLSPPVLPPLGLEPGDTDVPRGASAGVVLRAPERERATLHWQAAGEVPMSSVLVLDESGEAAFELPPVTAPLRYWATAPDGARSEAFVLTPVDPLFVSDLRIEVAFPPHTGRLPEEYRADVPPLELPAGTRVRIDGRASRALTEGSLDLLGGARVQRLTVAGAAFSTLWVPVQSGIYEWRFRDAEGALAELGPRPLELTLVPDAPPEVWFTYPAQDTVMPITLRQPLALEVRDDYGVSSLELVAYRLSASGEVGEPVLQRMELGGAREALAQPTLDFTGWGLLPGDRVRYLARATDNAPSAQISTTREWVLRMPGAAELRRGAQEQLEQAGERALAMAREAERRAEETRNLERQAAAADRSASGDRNASAQQGDFQQRQDVRQALERQEALAAGVDSLRAELQDLSQAMREAGLADPGLRSDLEELQQLLREASTPELRDRLRELARGLDEMDGRQAQQALRSLSESLEEQQRRLEETVERFRRAAVEQDFRATTAEAEELARLERALAEALKEGGDAELRADQQADLAQRAEEMGAHMQALEQRLSQLGEDEAGARVEEARRQADQSKAAMAQAEQSARAGETRQAGEQAERAAAAMEQAASELQDARQDMADQSSEALRRTFEGAADEALALARRQSEIRDQMRGAGAEEMAGLRGDEAALLQGVSNIAENVATALQQSGASDREFSERAGEAMAAVERTLDAMERRPGPSPSPVAAAESAIDALNRLALSALSAAGEAGQDQGQAGDLMEQLEALAQQQGQLNNETGQIAPMQLGQQALQTQLQDVAQGQESVGNELGRLANEPGADGALGDLEALAQEARELAERLAGGRLDAETRQRQERLFHRLLDAGRSLEKEDEFSEERESRTAGATEARDVSPLSAEAVGALRFRLPDAAVLQRYGPAERQLVIQYFERLNREAPRSAAPPAGTSASPPAGSQGGPR